MDTSKRSHAAPLTFNVVSCIGVLMSKVLRANHVSPFVIDMQPKRKNGFPPCAISVTLAKSRVTVVSQRILKPKKKTKDKSQQTYL